MLLAALVQVSLPAAARAQVLHDHLKCYKIKDATKFIATARLSALQSEFGVEDCQLKGKARLLCAPVNKVVTSFDDRSKGQFGQLSFAGPELSLDRICYKLKCPVTVIDPLEVTDQFGTRKVGKFKAVLLCTPAQKGALPTTTTSSTTTTTAVADLCAGVICSASDPCHDIGICNPLTGLCSDPTKPDGTSCDDGNPATSNDQCISGTCVGVL